MRAGIFFSLFTLVFLGCVQPFQTFSKIPPGRWRGVLLLDRMPVMKYGDDRDVVKKFDIESELPFNFDISYDQDSMIVMTIINGEERIEVKDISFGRDIYTQKDTVVINFPVYDTYIKAIYEDGVMEGDWIVNFKDHYAIPFKAKHGDSKRFDIIPSGEIKDFSGSWACTFEPDSPDSYPAQGYFKQDRGQVTGTFMTETGDYRYLDGVVSGSKMYLSAFDGAHAFLFNAKMLNPNEVTGSFRSGSHFTTTWIGHKTDSFSLKDPYALTTYKKNQAVDFSFINTEGETVRLSDQKFQGKPKIIQIFGTWCPNCMDETVFLQDYLSSKDSSNIALISIGFERYEDTLRSLNALKRFKNQMNIDTEVLYGGYFKRDLAKQALPWLDQLVSYPTLILLDKNNVIQQVHTGFSGPATPNYASFKQEFEENLNKIR